MAEFYFAVLYLVSLPHAASSKFGESDPEGTQSRKREGEE